VSQLATKPIAILSGVAIIIAGAWYFTRPPAYIKIEAPTKALTKALPTGPIIEDEEIAFAGYAGDTTCKTCHASEFEKWAKSNHALAERPFSSEMDHNAFEPAKTIKHGTQQTTAQLNDAKPVVITTGFNNEIKPWPVARIIGNDPLRQFLVQGDNGRVHTMEACWDPRKNEWFNVYGNEDRKPGEWGHWTGRGMVWNTMCAECHNTRVRKNYDSKTDTFHTTMAQQTVSCEACHGPMKQHAVDYQNGKVKAPAPSPNAGVNASGVVIQNTPKRDQMRDTCAMCHARRSELTGDFKPGDDFFDHFTPSIVDHSDIFYADGQIRDEDYEFGPFLASRMHHAGVRCVDCHDPHAAKPILQGNQLCMRCHTAGGFPNAPAIIPAAHTFHQPESTGSQCVNCHMPQTVYMQRHSRHDHGFTIPDPLLTKQFNIPNACNRCHQDKDTDWSLAAADKWFGDKMNRRTRTRTTIIAKAKRGDFDARDALISLLKGDETPYWKASATLLLDQWLGDSSVQTAVQDQLKHEHPLVRSSAVRSLEVLAEDPQSPARSLVEPLLTDPIRSVRVAAAWALRDHVDLESTAGKELLHSLELNADQPSGQMQLGQFDYARHNMPGAIAHMKRAVAWDPGSPPFYHDLAMMQNLGGDTKGSLESLMIAIKLNPNEAEYYYKIGLAWNELGNLDKTIAALRDAVKISPQHSRSWYNLGLALNAQKKTEEALAALTAGAKANPNDPGIPYAKATILTNIGRKDEARMEVFRVLNIAPTMPEALQLRDALK
jgi:tetratricopeptide (TPR) repeat protein